MLEMIEMIDYTENLNQELSEAYEAFINDGPKTNKSTLRTTNSSLSYRCNEKQLKQINK